MVVGSGEGFSLRERWSNLKKVLEGGFDM